MNEPPPDTGTRLTPPPEGYAAWPADLKARIHTAQQRATLAVNHELVLLYWQIGCDSLARQAAQGNTQPLGVSEYQLLTALPEELLTSLPSIEQIERELTGAGPAAEEAD